MSTSSQHDSLDPNSLLYYAPRRLRDRASALRTMQTKPEEAGGLPPAAPVPHERRTTISHRGRDEVVHPRNGAPYQLERATDDEGVDLDVLRHTAPRNEMFGTAIRFAAVAGIAAGIAFIYVVSSSGWKDAPPSAENVTTIVATQPIRKVAEQTPAPQRVAAAPKIGVEDGNGSVNEALPLGIKVIDPAPNSVVTLSGLAPETRLNTGASAGPGRWRTAVDDLPVTAIVPPRDFVGQMNVVAEVSGGDGQPGLRSVVRLSWHQAAPAQKSESRLESFAMASAGSTAAPPAAEGVRQYDPKEVAAWIKRAEDLATNGDIPAARLLLQRAAETHNALAAFELGATYDPIVTKQFGANGARPDVNLARSWYQKARDWGSPDAPKHLEALASARQ